MKVFATDAAVAFLLLSACLQFYGPYGQIGHFVPDPYNNLKRGMGNLWSLFSLPVWSTCYGNISHEDLSPAISR